MGLRSSFDVVSLCIFLTSMQEPKSYGRGVEYAVRRENDMHTLKKEHSSEVVSLSISSR